MGCDIHLHSEIKINGRWHCYGSPNPHRNYRLFARMANVRNYGDIVPIAEPRGLPSDVSVVVKFSADDYGTDGHSHSYLTSAEIAELEQWYEAEGKYPHEDKLDPFWFEKTFGFLFGNTYPGFNKYPDERPKGLEDVRFVFWFDN